MSQQLLKQRCRSTARQLGHQLQLHCTPPEPTVSETARRALAPTGDLPSNIDVPLTCGSQLPATPPAGRMWMQIHPRARFGGLSVVRRDPAHVSFILRGECNTCSMVGIITSCHRRSRPESRCITETAVSFPKCFLLPGSIHGNARTHGGKKTWQRRAGRSLAFSSPGRKDLEGV